MRIGLYIYKLGFGGAERVVCRTSKILQRNGHQVFIITDEEIEAAYEYGGDYINLNIPHNVHGIKSLPLIFRRIKILKKVKTQNNIEVVISFLLQPNIVNILSKVTDCKCFVSIRNRFLSEDYESIFQRLFFKLVKILYKKANGVISVSNLVNYEAVKYLNVPKEKSYTLYNPYDIETLVSESHKIIDSDLSDKLSDKTFKFVSTGRFTHQKGFWHLIKAFAKVHEEHTNTKLILIGDGEQKEQIKELISEFDIDDSVIMPGFRKDVFAIEKKCDAYVMTSLFEGFPNALTEAMCIGLPIISTDCKSGPKEILAPQMDINAEIIDYTEAEFGILIPAYDSNEDWSKNVTLESCLIEAMTNIMDSDINKIYSDKSICRARDFSEEKFYSDLVDIIVKS